MKLIPLVAVAMLGSLGFTAAAWADTPPTSGEAAQLVVEERTASEAPGSDPDRFHVLSTQINQRVSGASNPDASEEGNFLEGVSLPDDIVIIESVDGGYAIGTEL